jgi:L-serine dehydratase
MYVSIFNDVIGPIMRGPSSSHCTAALRIGRLALDLMEGDLKKVIVEFDREGALATTHVSQGSDMGLFGGLMGWDAVDDRLPDSVHAIANKGIDVSIKIVNLNVQHPNVYCLKLSNKRYRHVLTAISTGGGMIKVIDIDGFSVSIEGDYRETLIYTKEDSSMILDYLTKAIAADEVLIHTNRVAHLLEVKAQEFIDDVILSEMKEQFNIFEVKKLSPVLPVLSRGGLQIPFTTCKQMLDHKESPSESLWETALIYECARGNLTEQDVFKRMNEIVRIMRNCVEQGLKGTDYEDRILGRQSDLFFKKMKEKTLFNVDLLNRIILYITAIMEVKSAMGIIVAAPTAGSCAVLPGACLAVCDELGLCDEDVVKAMLAGGMIGVFIASRSTFAAEVGGCQAECGAASGMAAAALVTLGGGTAEQAVVAASMALQNSLGMVCDPVANRVEVPCLGKNVMAASNALACANMALADYDPVIPLDEVIEAMDKVGRSLPYQLRCTALGGLSVTETSRAIEAKLKGRLRNEG